MSNEIATLGEIFSGDGALVKQDIGELQAAKKFSKKTKFLRQVQLFNGGKMVKSKKIEDGHFGIVLNKNEVLDLGTSVDIIPFVKRSKAVDFSDRDNIIVNFTPGSAEFQRIEEFADQDGNIPARYGPTYLIWIRSEEGFYEYFCNNPSQRRIASDFDAHLPQTQEMIDAGLSLVESPRFAEPMTVKSDLVEWKGDTFFAPVVEKCLTPFNVAPTKEELVEQVNKFLGQKNTEVEVVEKKTSGRKT